MPIYEYECKRCGTISQYLILRRGEEKEIRCRECGSSDIKRIISRVVYHMSEKDRLEAYDPTRPKDDSFYKDTRNIGLHAKKMAQKMGVDLGAGFEEKLDKLRTDPGSVIRDSE